MGRDPRFTVAEAEAALKETKGMVYLAADLLGVAGPTLCQRMSKYPYLKEIAESFREKRTDVAESKLGNAIDEGKEWAVLFQLRTIGKKRGFVERKELEHSGEIALPEVKTIVVAAPGMEEDQDGVLDGQ